MEATFLGISSSILLCGLFYSLNVNPQLKFIFLLIALLTLISISIHQRLKDDSERNFQRDFRYLISLVSVVACLSMVYGGNISGNNIRQRVGPDLLGWVNSAIYIEENYSKTPLQDWLEQSFPRYETKNPFSKDQFGTENSIYFTDEYTKQLQAEFLIGAKRVGITAWYATWLKILPGEGSWKFMYLAITSVFQFLLIGFLVESWSRRGRVRLLSSIILVSSFGVLLPVFEGGLGQHYAMTAFIFLLNIFKRRSFFDTTLIFPSMALTYMDFFFFTLPFFLSYALIFYRVNLNRVRKDISIKLRILIFLLCSGLIWLTNPAKRLSSISFGGWSEGYTPSIFDMVGVGGIYTWTGPEKMRGIYSMSSFAISIGIVAFLQIKLWKSEKWKWGLIFPLLFYISLFGIAWHYNNDYILWKSLPFFSIFIAHFFCMSSSYATKKKKLWYRGTKLLVLCQSLSAFIFTVSWLSSSSIISIYNLSEQDSKALTSIVNTYALDFKNIAYINTFSVLGDMSWGTPARQMKDQPAKLSSRKVVTVIPSKVCDGASDRKLVIYSDARICIVNISR